ncbi:MAG: hypothetical protein E7420_07440 [Ruminococcaceae bacterium]|nr:hypothetical protein [Oscillospiraceae bacterium]
MTFSNILGSLLIGPLKLIFEIIFQLASRFIWHPGLVIIVLSLVMNILVLPLYRRADAMQEEARDIDIKLREGVAHIKKTFSGDERMLILQTYYRQNNYKPTDTLKGSVSLLLEIPFFIAAYQFLSHLDILNGVSLGPIADLGAPDALIVIGGLTLNLLPILMTAINVISSALYLKGFPLKAKIQLYGMALFFLVFLYNSPACLVFYWTLNNVFSLVKNIFYKLKNPRLALRILSSLIGLLSIAVGIFVITPEFIKRKIFLIGIGLLLQLPYIIPFIAAKINFGVNTAEPVPHKRFFITGCLFLVVLTGLLIPSAYISSSPLEFFSIANDYNPIWYIVSSTCLAIGSFIVWFNVFYWLASPRIKALFDKLVWCLCGVMLVNYMFFGTNLGVITPMLQYEGFLTFELKQQLFNLLIVALVALVMYFFASKWRRAATMVMLTAVIALSGMSIFNIGKINTAIVERPTDYTDNSIQFQLSKNGKNVVVLMLDRGMAEYIPFIMKEKPVLEEKFDGFTFYANTVSYGRITNIAAPALFGGYEYTPVELNKRNNEALADKHNESLKVMPVIFSENNYKVTVCDPPYAGYSWLPDLSIYDEYPEINTYITKGKIYDADTKAAAAPVNRRNFFVFSIMKSMPLILQPTIYNNGQYCRVSSFGGEFIYTTQEYDGISRARGISMLFTDPYNVLLNLSEMSEITESATNTFLMLTNDSTHEPMLLQTPDYVPMAVVDNTEYDALNLDRFCTDGKTLRVDNYTQMSHYHANMAALLRLSDWFDYMRENDVYDNTRIILVADHGKTMYQLEELGSIEEYYPLLMVKDFDSHGFTTSYEFMTNADVPTLATADIIENPTNPFTGNPINSNEKTAHEQFLSASGDWELEKNNGNAFLPSTWVSVKDNIWDKNNWTFYNETSILTEHAFPQP